MLFETEAYPGLKPRHSSAALRKSFPAGPLADPLAGQLPGRHGSLRGGEDHLPHAAVTRQGSSHASKINSEGIGAEASDFQAEARESSKDVSDFQPKTSLALSVLA